MTDSSPELQRGPIFPRSRLATGERLLWEGRPSSIVYFVQPLVLFILTVIFGIVMSLNYDPIGTLEADWTIWVTLAVLLLLMPMSTLRMGMVAMAVGVAILVVGALGCTITASYRSCWCPSACSHSYMITSSGRTPPSPSLTVAS